MTKVDSDANLVVVVAAAVGDVGVGCNVDTRMESPLLGSRKSNLHDFAAVVVKLVENKPIDSVVEPPDTDAGVVDAAAVVGVDADKRALEQLRVPDKNVAAVVGNGVWKPWVVDTWAPIP